ncbi:MAG: GNAT family N-acetyltransferase [Kofleriaceae bacterium]
MTAALARPVESRITLRRAEPGDCQRVHDYNFSADARAVSGSTAAVSYADHARWFGNRLADRAAPIWIVEHGGAPIGTVRIDVRDGATARISIALEAAGRGNGNGRRAVELACASWKGPVIAEIHPANARSRTCFLACGFAQVGTRDGFDVLSWTP